MLLWSAAVVQHTVCVTVTDQRAVEFRMVVVGIVQCVFLAGHLSIASQPVVRIV